MAIFKKGLKKSLFTIILTQLPYGGIVYKNNQRGEICIQITVKN